MRSCWRSFSSACSTVIAACFAASSRSRIGAQLLQRARSTFQQMSLHTHVPHRLHWRNSGLISSTADSSAWSCSGPPTAFWISYAPDEARPKIPPKMLPAARTTSPAMPALFACQLDMYPFPHDLQWNLNWKPVSVDRSS